MHKLFIPSSLLADNRVHLTPIVREDIELLRLWRNSDDARIWFADSRIIAEQDQVSWFESYIGKPNDLMFAVWTNDERPVGTAALYHIDPALRRAEFGRLVIGPADARRRGYATAATRILCAAGFAALGLDTVLLEVLRENHRARQLYEHLGFRPTDDAAGTTVRMILTKAAMEDAIVPNAPTGDVSVVPTAE